MADKTITINAKVKASLEGMDNVVKQLNNKLKNSKIELSDTSVLSKSLKEYNSAREELDRIFSKGFVNPDEVKNVDKLSKKIKNLYEEIETSIRSMKGKEIVDLKKIFPANFSTKAKNGLKEISDYLDAVSKKEIKAQGLNNLNNELSLLETQLEKINGKRIKIEVESDIELSKKKIEDLEGKKQQIRQSIVERESKEEVLKSGKTRTEYLASKTQNATNKYNKAVEQKKALEEQKSRQLTDIEKNEIEQIEKRTTATVNELEQKKAQLKEEQRKILNEIGKREGDQSKRRSSYRKDLSKEELSDRSVKIAEELRQVEKKITEEKETQRSQVEKIQGRPKEELKQVQKQAEVEVERTKSAKERAEAAEKEYQQKRKQVIERAEKTADDFVSGKTTQGGTDSEIAEIKAINEALGEQINLQKQLTEEKKEAFKSSEEKEEQKQKTQLQIDKKNLDKTKLERDLENLKESADIDELWNKLGDTIDLSGFEKTEEGIKQLKQALKELDSEPAKKILSAFDEVEQKVEDVKEDVKKLGDGLEEINWEDNAIKSEQRDIENLQESILHFFSIGNTIEIFKRSVRDAFDTVKELDAVMTETAVVTDFTVGDMWEKLPEYAEQASELGASIKDLYGATTLYYQQGLNSDAAMNVGIETMKMARIANMEASEATQAMTAALRGFNMEINEQSATRVNDVYSELAAITAADTNQIATAMTKTASIADAANMEFEVTAALLAQIIETTQEAPETAGTAMKTIIARFTEVKELFSEGMLSGKDAEGEEININKIDAALKTVGISLKDFLNGTKGIDDIFLELASKWDTLDLATQRYIATTAAGSRQQSRFIAMMSNYDRTMELVNAANDSAGASQNQYEKTLESMEAKLQKLANAWDVFVMGLANNEALKFGIDALTKLLEVANKLTEALSGKSGLAKTVISFMTVMGAMKGGKTLLNAGSKFLFNQELFKTAIGKNGQPLGSQYFQTPMAAFSQAIKKGFNMPQLPSMQQIYEKQQGKSKPWVIKKPKIVIDEKAYQKALDKEKADYLKEDSFDEFQPKAKREDFAKEVAGLSLGINEVSVAAMGAGAAINLLGQGMSAIGWEEAGELASDFGGTLSGLGGIASMLGPLLSGLGLSAGPLAGILIAISAIVALAPRVQQAMHAATPEGKLEAAQEATQKAGEAAEAAAASYESLKNAMDDLNSNYRTLNKMTKGTQKWKEASKDLNEEVLNLIDRYPELRDQFEYQNGVLVKKQGADAEINKILKQDEVDVQKAKQVETQRKIEETKAGLNVLSNYGLDYFTGAAYDRASGAVSTEVTQVIADAIRDQEISNGQELEEWFARTEYAQDYTFTLTDKTFENYFKYGEEREVAEGKYDTQIANNLKDQAEILGQSSKEFSEFDSGLMADTRDQIYKSELAKYESKEITDIDKQNYADLMNYRFAYGKFYDKTSGAEITGITADAIRVGLASAFADSATINSISSVFSALKNNPTLQRAYSEDGQNLQYQEAAHLDSLIKGAGGNQEILLQNLKNQGYDLETLSKETGIGINSLIDNLVSNVDNAKDRIANQKVELVSQMNKYTTGEEIIPGLNFIISEVLEEEFGKEFTNTFSDVMNSLSLTGDDSLIGGAYADFFRVAMTGTKEQVQELADFINNDVNWSNPIEAAYKLNREMKNGSETTKQFAKNLLSTENQFLGIGSQTKYLVESSDFESIQEDILQILETSDSISASNILDLADSYESLNKILKNTENSAAGVARALEAVAKGEIGAHQLTNAVMASLSDYKGFSSMIAGLNKEISEFDPGIDENFASSFMGQVSQTLTGNVQKGAYGNSQNKKYLDYLLGPDWDAGVEYGKGYEEKLRYASQQISKNANNMSHSWRNLASNKDFWGNAVELNEDNAESWGKLQVKNDGKGGVELTGFEGMTTDELVSTLADAYNVSKEYAELMLTDFSNYSSDLMYELDKNDYTVSIEKAAAALRTTAFYDLGDANYKLAGTKKTADKSEIEAIAKLLSKDYQIVATDMGLGEEDITNFYDESGNLRTPQDIMDELNRVTNSQTSEQWEGGGRDSAINMGRTWADNFITSVEKEAESGEKKIEEALDFEGMMKGIGSLGLPEGAQNELANQVLQSYAEGTEKAEVQITDIFGQPQTIELTPEMTVEDIQGEINRLQEQTKIDMWTDAFSNIKIDGNADGLITEIKAVKNTANKPPLTIKPILGAGEGGSLSTQVSTELVSQTYSVEVSADASKAASAVNAAIPGSKTITVGIALANEGVKFEGAGGSFSFTLTVYKDGIKDSPYGAHPALVGEEGPELIQTKDGAYIAGLNGPEMTEINRGDTVYTADETEQILKGGKHTAFPRFASGYNNASGGAVTAIKQDDEEEKWENPFDKLYNLVREIDEELHNRERLERRYEKLLQDLGVSANTIVQYSLEELKKLEQERKLQEKLISSRRDQIDAYQNENAELKEYAWVEKNENGEDVLRIAWDKINAITDPKKGEQVETYVSQMEEWFDSLTEAKEALWEIEDVVQEIKERGKDQYKSLEEKIKNALAGNYQKQIDDMQMIFDTIEKANNELIDSIQKNIDKQRQERDNQRTEQDLAEKERRLAYLRQDTSNANQMEILSLEEEIKQGRQDYTDTLVDQKISALQEQNEEASKQRQQQIELAQTQLDFYIASGDIWNEVYQLMSEGMNAESGLIRGKRLEEILQSEDNYAGLSVIGKQEWYKELNNTIAQGLGFLHLGNQIEDTGKYQKGDDVTFYMPNGTKQTGIVQEDGSVITENGTLKFEDVYQGYSGQLHAGDYGNTQPSAGTATNFIDHNGVTRWGVVQEDGTIWGTVAEDPNYIYNFKLSGWDTTQNIPKVTEAPSIKYWKEAFINDLVKTGKVKWTKVYKTGGLADFTGPAWLDGTKSRPEIVLNQQDSQNFIQLRDILSSVLKNTGHRTSTENNGDITYDIDINVEKIGDDYSVEQVANKVKSLITESARYRNSTVVSLKR